MRFQKSFFYNVMLLFGFCLTLNILTAPAGASHFGYSVGDTFRGFCTTCNQEQNGVIDSFSIPALCDLGSSCYWICSVCSTYIGSEVGPWEHAWELVNTRPPTCTQKGQTRFSCNACRLGDDKLIDIPATGHSWVETGRLEPACGITGRIDKKCSVCSETAAEYISSLTHDMNEIRRTHATCTTPGMIYKECSRCDWTETKEIPALGGGHAWTEASRIPATCTAAGSVSYDCSVCPEKKTDSIPAPGHAWTETSRTPATCTAAGSIGYTCSR